MYPHILIYISIDYTNVSKCLTITYYQAGYWMQSETTHIVYSIFHSMGSIPCQVAFEVNENAT